MGQRLGVTRNGSASSSLRAPAPWQSMPTSSSAASAGRCAARPRRQDASRGLSVSALSRPSADSAGASDQLCARLAFSSPTCQAQHSAWVLCAAPPSNKLHVHFVIACWIRRALAST